MIESKITRDEAAESPLMSAPRPAPLPTIVAWRTTALVPESTLSALLVVGEAVDVLRKTELSRVNVELFPPASITV
jgi:hypothetical protein